MKKFLILLLIIPNLLFAHKHITAEDVVSERQTSPVLNVYALGVVEGLIHSYTAYKALNGIKTICYRESYSTPDWVSIIDGHYLKNKSTYAGMSYVFTADSILRKNFPCN